MAGFITVEALPRETTALTPAIEPFEQHLARQMKIQVTALSVVCDGIVIQVPLNPLLSLAK